MSTSNLGSRKLAIFGTGRARPVVLAALVAMAAVATIGPALRGAASQPSPSVPLAASAAAASGVRVEVSSRGFQPSRVELGDARVVTFRRTSDATCATAVVFPELGIQRALPLNIDVAIELPPAAKGEIAFQCGMGMYRGKLLAR